MKTSSSVERAELMVEGRACSPRSALPSSRRGMTLLELVIAFAIFALMIAALVALGSAGLETWREGEVRKDAYDRGQRILDQVSEDLRNTFADDRWYMVDGRPRQAAALLGDADRSRNGRIRFVRSGSRDRMNIGRQDRLPEPPSDMFFTDLWEVAWMMDSDPSKPLLYRAVRYFERQPERTSQGRVNDSLLADHVVDDSSDPFFRRFAEPVDNGVLWIGFKYWTQYTSTWSEGRAWVCPNPTHAQVRQHGLPGRCPSRGKDKACDRELVSVTVAPPERVRPATQRLIGPSSVWDSTRVRTPGFFFRKPMESDASDFVYPEIIQVTLVVESTATELRGAALAEEIDERADSIRLVTAGGLPQEGSLAKIDGEWISYERREGLTLSGVKRGLRDTKAARHGARSLARHGETFVTDVRIPAYREAVR